MVSIVSMAAPGFNPASVTVPVNTVVQWTNNDSSGTLHTVTSTTVPANGTFDSGNLALGATICLKFTSAGAFNYHCTNHPTTMIGLVTVQ
jgi:plastocyanin